MNWLTGFGYYWVVAMTFCLLSCRTSEARDATTKDIVRCAIWGWLLAPIYMVDLLFNI